MIVDLEAFNGPLELLLQLIEKEEIDIYDIPINQITDAYLKSLDEIDIGPDEMVDFILMASSLIEIKSKMMLPKASEEEDPREDLVKRLLEYQKVKEAAKLLLERKTQADKKHARYRNEIIVEDVNINLDENVDLLAETFYTLISQQEEGFIERDIISSDPYKIEDYGLIIEDLIAEKKEFKLSDLVYPEMEKIELIVIFLAMLELVKEAVVRVKQIEGKNDLLIYKMEE